MAFLAKYADFGLLLLRISVGVLFIPVFYVAVRRVLGDKLEPREETLALTKDPHAHGGQ